MRHLLTLLFVFLTCAVMAQDQPQKLYVDPVVEPGELPAPFSLTQLQLRGPDVPEASRAVYMADIETSRRLRSAGQGQLIVGTLCLMAGTGVLIGLSDKTAGFAAGGVLNLMGGLLIPIGAGKVSVAKGYQRHATYLYWSQRQP